MDECGFYKWKRSYTAPLFLEKNNMRLIVFLLLLFLFCSFTEEENQNPPGTYMNPVINRSLPDPTIIRDKEGVFYLYSTESARNLPIYKSEDLVNWQFAGTAFSKETRPTFEPKGGLWAPDIDYIKKKYVLYYAMSRWGGEETCGIGRAVADKPEGPFRDMGKLFTSNEIQVRNSIDPFFIKDRNKNHLFWGSFRGIYAIGLSADGLNLKEGDKPQQIAGTDYEAVYVHKKDGYYYLFASVGSCCAGEKSTYTLVVGRSKELMGPYCDKEGRPMMKNFHEILLHGDTNFVGTGHNAEIVTDDNGTDWILYHAYVKGNTRNGRVLMMDKLSWESGWPDVANDSPCASLQSAPYFKNKQAEK